MGLATPRLVSVSPRSTSRSGYLLTARRARRGFDVGLEARLISKVDARRGACFEIRARSKSRVDRLALKRQNAEHALVHASQRLIASESLECLEA
jgi:hypothetical protein